MSSLLIPMAFIVFYMVAIGVFTFITRVRAVVRRQVHPKYFSTYDSSKGAPAEYVVRVGRHFDNQMQAPVVFLITLLTCLQIGLVSASMVIAAWLFVGTRILHTIIHLGSNNVRHRATSYFAGWGIMVYMWIMILIHMFQQS